MSGALVIPYKVFKAFSVSIIELSEAKDTFVPLWKIFIKLE